MIKQVKVDWIDSMSGDSNWHLLSETIDLKPLKIRTFGFLVEDNDDYICVAQSYATEYPQYCNTISIPKKTIVKITEIR